MHRQCSRKRKSVLLPLQMVGSEGSVPVTSLAAGMVPGISAVLVQETSFL